MQKRRRVPFIAAQGEVPISALNTTPLIEVMLVLLIMFIVTIPITTHKVAVDLPQATPDAQLPPIVHRLDIDAAGGLSWNGRPIAREALPRQLAAMRGEANAVLHLRADAETPYDVFDRTLAVVKGAGIERLGLVDNARFAAAPG